MKLREDVYQRTVGLFYNPEELDALILSRVGEDSVLVATPAGREIGPLPFAHVELKD